MIKLFESKIEIYEVWGPGKWDVDRLIETSENIEGIKFVRLENIARWKEIYGRKKDIEWIGKIKDYLKSKEKK